jgi:hypothetical protein
MGKDPGTFSDFLRQDNEFEVERVNRIDYWAKHVWGWMKVADIVVQYEALPYPKFVPTVADVLGLKVLDNITPVNLGDRKSSAVAPRKGEVGDWKNHFTPEDLGFFDSKAWHLMKKLGYYEDRSGKK